MEPLRKYVYSLIALHNETIANLNERNSDYTVWTLEHFLTLTKEAIDDPNVYRLIAEYDAITKESLEKLHVEHQDAINGVVKITNDAIDAVLPMSSTSIH